MVCGWTFSAGSEAGVYWEGLPSVRGHGWLKYVYKDSKARKTQLATGFQSILVKSKLLDVRSSSCILLNLVSNALQVRKIQHARRQSI